MCPLPIDLTVSLARKLWIECKQIIESLLRAITLLQKRNRIHILYNLIVSKLTTSRENTPDRCSVLTEWGRTEWKTKDSRCDRLYAIWLPTILNPSHKGRTHRRMANGSGATSWWTHTHTPYHSRRREELTTVLTMRLPLLTDKWWFRRERVPTKSELLLAPKGWTPLKSAYMSVHIFFLSISGTTHTNWMATKLNQSICFFSSFDLHSISFTFFLLSNSTNIPS